MLCSKNQVQLCSASTGGSKMDPVQFGPFRFTCKHRDPILNALKPPFENRMASLKMRLTDCSTNRQKSNKYGRRNEIILARNCITRLFFVLRVNTHTPERFLYRIQEIDPARKIIRYRVGFKRF